MIDIVSRTKRSEMMSGIKSRNTRPEKLLRSHLHSLGLRYRLNTKIFNFRTDVVLRKHRTAIFVHGCFWHRHKNCKIATVPKSNTDFWEKKFKQNVNRDKKNLEILMASNWSAIIVWECAIRNGEAFDVDYRQILGQGIVEI